MGFATNLNTDQYMWVLARYASVLHPHLNALLAPPRRAQSTSHTEDRALALLARTATAYVTDMARESAATTPASGTPAADADGSRRLARALENCRARAHIVLVLVFVTVLLRVKLWMCWSSR